jgi:plasmid replication initiation protein
MNPSWDLCNRAVLNDKIIKPAVREVNRHSDVIITPYFTKNGRRVATIRFTVQDNKQMPLFKVEEEDQITESKAYKELIKRNMSKVFSRQAVLDFYEEYIFEQLGIADGYAAKKMSCRVPNKGLSARQSRTVTASLRSLCAKIAEKRPKRTRLMLTASRVR